MVSGVDTDKEKSAMLKDYDVVHSEHEYERSPPRLELAEQYREYILNKSTQSPIIRRTLPSSPSSSHPPHSTINISSVRFRPVPMTAQAVMTSTHGHPRLTWPAVAKVNNIQSACHTISMIYNQHAIYNQHNIQSACHIQSA